jgi:hypothetical protein
MTLLAGFLGALDEDGNPLPRTLEEQEEWVTTLWRASKSDDERYQWARDGANPPRVVAAAQREADRSMRLWAREYRKLERMRAKTAKAGR